MARKLFLTHPPLADASSIASPLSNSPTCSDNAALFIEDDGRVNATLVHAATTDQIGVLPSLSKETDSPRVDVSAAALDDKISRYFLFFRCGLPSRNASYISRKILLGMQVSTPD